MAQAIELSKSILVHAVMTMTSSGNKPGSRGQELLVTVEDESTFVLGASSRLSMDQLLEEGAKNITKRGLSIQGSCSDSRKGGGASGVSTRTFLTA